MTDKLQKRIMVGSVVYVAADPSATAKQSLQKPFRLLSLSGGGMRGIYQSFFLHELSKSLPDKPLNKNFDLFIGTSTGAIVALAIALNKSLGVVTKMYESEGSNIFSKLPFWSQFLQGPLYNSNILRKALKTIFGVQKLGECVGCTPSGPVGQIEAY